MRRSPCAGSSFFSTCVGTARPSRPVAAGFRLPHQIRELRSRPGRTARRAQVRRPRRARRPDERRPGRRSFRTCATEMALIRETVRAGKPMLGICLGGQLLAAAMGGHVRPNRGARDRLVPAAYATGRALRPPAAAFRAAPQSHLPVARLRIRAAPRGRAAGLDAQLPPAGLSARRAGLGPAIPPRGGRGPDRALAASAVRHVREIERHWSATSHRAYPRGDTQAPARRATAQRPGLWRVRASCSQPRRYATAGRRRYRCRVDGSAATRVNRRETSGRPDCRSPRCRRSPGRAGAARTARRRLLAPARPPARAHSPSRDCGNGTG